MKSLKFSRSLPEHLKNCLNFLETDWKPTEHFNTYFPFANPKISWVPTSKIIPQFPEHLRGSSNSLSSRKISDVLRTSARMVPVCLRIFQMFLSELVLQIPVLWFVSSQGSQRVRRDPFRGGTWDLKDLGMILNPWTDVQWSWLVISWILIYRKRGFRSDPQGAPGIQNIPGRVHGA